MSVESYGNRQTYRAVLRGDYVEWIDGRPDPRTPADVEITVLQSESEEERLARGIRMARALERVSQAKGAFSEIADPVAWQREIRQDRPLPGREE